MKTPLKIIVTSTMLSLMGGLCAAPALAHSDATQPAHTHGATTQEIQQLNSYTSILKRGAAEYYTTGPAIDVDTSLLESSAKARKALLEQIAVKDPNAFLGAVLSPLERQRLPASVKAHLEVESTKQGVVNVLYRDDFKNPENSTTEYYLRVGAMNYRIAAAQNIPVARSGAKITANVYTLGSVAVVKRGAANIAVNTPPPPLESLGEQKTLVFLFDYTDSPERAFTAAQLQEDLNNGEINQLFREQSDGKTWINADVYDWQRINKSMPTTGETPDFDSSDFTRENSSLFRAIRDLGVPLQEYSRVVFFVNNTNAACSYYAGWSTVGKISEVINGQTYQFSLACVAGGPEGMFRSRGDMLRYRDVIFAHEFGHSLGAWHANGLICEDKKQILGARCFHNEYGNRFDIMGGNNVSTHFSAYYKKILGWLDDSSMPSVTQSGTYTLAPLEGNSGVRGLLIRDPVTNVPRYALETRQPIGFDGRMKVMDPHDVGGVIVNRIPNIYGQDMQQLINNEAETHSPWDMDWSTSTEVYLPITLHDVGESFTDPSIGLTVRLDEVGTGTDAGVASLGITLDSPTCTPKHPSLYNSYNSYDWLWGKDETPVEQITSGWFFRSINLYNEDTPSCAPRVGQKMVFDLPIGWTAITPDSYQYPEVVMPKSLATVSGSFAIPEGIPAGTYTIGVRVLDERGEQMFSKEWQVRVVSIVRGDVDGDGKVTAKDALMTLKYAVGTDVLGFVKENADIDCSSSIAAVDALMILKLAVGQDIPTCTFGVGLIAQLPATNLTFIKEGSGLVTPAFSGTANDPIISLTATPATGQKFMGWQGVCTGTGACTVNLPDGADLALKAVFAPNEVTPPSVPPTAPPAPATGDLVILGGNDLRVTPTRPTVGREISVLAKVQNQTTLNARTFIASLRIDKGGDGTWDFADVERVFALKPNQSRAVKFKKSFMPDEVGQYIVQVCAGDAALTDASSIPNPIPSFLASDNELTSANNCAQKTITVEGQRKASPAAAGGILMGAGGIMTALAFVAMKSRVKVKV